MWKNQLTQETIQGIINNYVYKGYGQIRSGAEFNVGQRVVKSILQEYNIPLRNQSQAAKVSGQNARNYIINDDYFDIESPNMAYLLGFIASDGTVRKDSNEIKITLKKDDAEHLMKIKTELQSNKDITFYTTRNGYDSATFAFTSQKIKATLANYNIIPQKTFNFSFPVNLQRKYWIDFIRGYFDGDGSVSTAGKSAIRWQVCSATTDVLEKIINFFYEEYNINPVAIQMQMRKQPLYYIQYSSVPTRQIYNVLYTPNSLYLQRKKDKFEELI